MRPTKAAEKPERGEESKVKPMPDLRIRVGSGKITGGLWALALAFWAKPWHTGDMPAGSPHGREEAKSLGSRSGGRSRGILCTIFRLVFYMLARWCC